MNRFCVTLAAWLAAVAAAPAGAQVALPDMGASASGTLPPHKARELGAEAYRTIRRQARVIDDPLVTEYIESLGYRLVAQSLEPSQDYTFFVLAEPSVNAFAIPGGYIGIHSGLVTTAEKEDELAAVLAHEVAHVTQDHIARLIEDIQKLSLPVMLGMLGVILAGGGDPELTQAALITSQAAMIQRQINFTRVHESEADRIGINTLSRAGYDPESMADFFHRMERVNLAYGKGPSEFLRTHPVSSNRIAEAKGRAREVGSQEREHDPLNFLLMRERIRALAADNPRTVLEYYQATLDQAVNEPEAMAMRYGRAVALLRLERAGEAAGELRKLMEQDGERLAYHLSLAHAYTESGDTEAALAQYDELQNFYGNRHPVTAGHAEALMQAGRPAEAERLLRQLVRQRPGDVAVQRRYAHVADAAGAHVEARIAIAESYYLEGRAFDALQQLRQAQSEPGLKAQDRERLQARFDEIMRRLPEKQREKLEKDLPSRG